jgi:ElaB/YqjD/DUF883 family membrane-anchored ribosome-binding protein
MPTQSDTQDKAASEAPHNGRKSESNASGDTPIREELRHLGQEARDSASRQFDQVQKRIEDGLAEQPLKFIAIAGVVGFALGLLWVGRR